MLLASVIRRCLFTFSGIIYLTRTASAVPIGAGSGNTTTHGNGHPSQVLLLKYDYEPVINGPDAADPNILGEALQIIVDSLGITETHPPELKFALAPGRGYAGDSDDLYCTGYMITFHMRRGRGFDPSICGAYHAFIQYAKNFNEKFPQERAKILSGQLYRERYYARDTYETVLTFRNGKVQSGHWKEGKRTLDMVDHKEWWMRTGFRSSRDGKR
ncbi:MAG: hypothetical protein NXY57DRAFT_1001587 [Lentinula lateritia]|nr:MAG: hypothetical protein NXY57DRAFT_1001587 [Lentinula lateritia]